MSENTIPASINHIYLRREIVLICYNKTLLMGDGKKQKTFVNIEGMFPLCPVCGRELEMDKINEKNGWDCKCGEFISENLVINPFEGCTHGLNCNCRRKMRR